MKGFLLLYIYINELHFVSSILSRRAYRNLQDDGFEEENKCSHYVEKVIQENSSLTLSSFTTASFGIYSSRIVHVPNWDCTSTYDENYEMQEPKLESFGYYDTLDLDDIVQRQYSLLPYPTVTINMLAEEKYYYEKTFEKTKRPYSKFHGIILEVLNHFLFKGKNKFM